MSGSNVLSNLPWNCPVPYLDTPVWPLLRGISAAPVSEVQVVAIALPEELGALQCPSSFCARLAAAPRVEEDLGGQQARPQLPDVVGVWGLMSPVSALRPPLVLSLHLEQAGARDWQGDWHVGTHPHPSHSCWCWCLAPTTVHGN